MLPFSCLAPCAHSLRSMSPGCACNSKRERRSCRVRGDWRWRAGSAALSAYRNGRSMRWRFTQERNDNMKALTMLLKILTAGVAILVFQTIAGALVPIKATMPPHTLPWLLVANFMTAAVLVLIASRSAWRGWRLGVAISTIPIVLTMTNMIEGVIFLTNSVIDWASIVAQNLIAYELAVPLWILLFAKRPDAGLETYNPVDSRPLGERLWKFAACDASYPVLYFAAG